ncbi:hypothetical protein QN277_019236 [Acacia crassicarpa]|uniref:Myb/SANT-like domain-containing protein n=1 Tax=Acacia crassicarpa TaxID=499986 RepID=A0AAE1JYA6_9FABA|nr:hypothetical protein QN277_019236 [Acacia crassicarpa]
MSFSTMSEKASWDKKNTKVLIDLCMMQVQKGRRKTTSLNEEGWEELVKNFMINTGKTYDKNQLKNKFHSLRGQWQCWNMLLRETGVGWDYEKKTILADHDWWEKKIAEVSGYEKFRYEGIQFKEELSHLFPSSVAMGPNQWAPSSKKLPTVLPTFVAPEYDLEEGYGDSDEVLGATTGLNTNVNAFNLTSHSGGGGANTIKGKRKASSSLDKTRHGYRTTSSLRVRKRGDGKKRKMSASSKIADCLSRIDDTSDTEAHRSKGMTSHAYDISVTGVLDHLQQVEEVVADGEFYRECVHLLINKPPLREAYNFFKGRREELVEMLRWECVADRPAKSERPLLVYSRKR